MRKTFKTGIAIDFLLRTLSEPGKYYFKKGSLDAFVMTTDR